MDLESQIHARLQNFWIIAAYISLFHPPYFGPLYNLNGIHSNNLIKCMKDLFCFCLILYNKGHKKSPNVKGIQAFQSFIFVVVLSNNVLCLVECPLQTTLQNYNLIL